MAFKSLIVLRRNARPAFCREHRQSCARVRVDGHCGFGSLMLAKHHGLYTLGCLMATGIATCMIAGLTFLPALLNLLGRWRPLIKQPSADNSLSALGQEEPR